MDFPDGSDSKELPVKQETQVSLGQGYPLEKRWPPTPVFLPGESHGERSLDDHSPQRRKELDVTERLTHTHISDTA